MCFGRRGPGHRCLGEPAAYSCTGMTARPTATSAKLPRSLAGAVAVLVLCVGAIILFCCSMPYPPRNDTAS